MSSPAPDWLHHRATSTPRRCALVARGRTWTFADLDDDASRWARRLGTLGVRAGDRVATLLHNGAAPAILVHALLRLGATLVPLNTRLSDPELAWQLGDTAPKLLLVDGRTAPAAARVRREHPVLRVVSADAGGATLLGEPPLETREETDVALQLAHEHDDLLAIIYTSGTTGRPKGAMLTVGNFWWSAMGSALNLGVLPNDRWLACMPLFHVGGLSILLRAAIYGITAEVHDGFDERLVNDAIDNEGVTIVSVVATMLQRMLAERGGRGYPATLRCVLLGGGPAPRALLERCAAQSIPVMQTYGLTETASQVATLVPDDALRKLGSAGRPLYPSEVRIAPRDGGASSDGTGEILVRGPTVMAGYAGRPEESARTIVDGWLHTGDVGRLDDEGFLYVLDRRDDLIISGGENVYPAEVESALLAHPSVVEAGVVGAPDEQWGQRVVAVVRLAEGAAPHPSVDELRDHCRMQLASYKVPSEVRVVGEPLPRTASGKLKRGELAAALR